MMLTADDTAAPIESKVALPAIVTGLLGLGGGSLYALLLAYDVLSPSPQQSAALAGAGAFVLYAVQTVTAYVSPHTARPDLPDATADGPARRASVPLSSGPSDDQTVPGPI